MSETLALIKRLHLRKLCILEEIDELTMEKHEVEQQIDNILFFNQHKSQRTPLRRNLSRSPPKISDELADFLGKESGTEMAHTDVSRVIIKYIRDNNLQDKENRRNINPDEKLSTLFKLKDGDKLTYLNLQKHISHHITTA